jgi:hypothetical protein
VRLQPEAKQTEQNDCGLPWSLASVCRLAGDDARRALYAYLYENPHAPDARDVESVYVFTGQRAAWLRRHLPSRFALVWLGRTGNLTLDLVLALSAVFNAQAVSGLFLGYLWARYRNAWINVVIHTLVDVIPLVFLVAGASIKPT